MRPLLPLPFLLIAVPAVAADEPITIKLKLHAEPGQSVTTTSLHSDRGFTRIEDAAGNRIAETKPEGSETVETTTVLEADRDGAPTKYVRTYEKATEAEGGKIKTFTYQGRTVLVEKGKDGKFRVGVVGKNDFDPEDAEKLVQKANRLPESEAVMRQFAPGRTVKVGDSWPLDVKLVAAAMQVTADVGKSAATVKLAKVASAGKGRVGTFELDARLAVTELTGRFTLKFYPPIEFTMKGTIELAIDGSSSEAIVDLTAGKKGTSTWANAGGATGKVTFDISGRAREHQSAATTAREAKAPAVIWLAGAGEWRAFKPKDGSFAVEMPAAPKEETPKGAPGQRTVSWTATTDEGAVAYVVATTDFPGSDPSKVDPATVLEAVAKSHKDPKDLKDIKLDGHPGIEFRREDTAGGTPLEVHQRVVMANGRMYQQILIAEKGKARAADADRYFKSLRILVKPKDD